jgi:hypothetical protein
MRFRPKQENLAHQKASILQYETKGVRIYLNGLLNRSIRTRFLPWCRDCSSHQFLHLFALKMVVSFFCERGEGVLMVKLQA